MAREPGTKYGGPLTKDEIEELRCLIDAHYYKDCGGDKRRCLLCGKEEDL
jgi:hypothetical protein